MCSLAMVKVLDGFFEIKWRKRKKEGGTTREGLQKMSWQNEEYTCIV